MILGRLNLPHDNAVLRAMKVRLVLALGLVEARLGKADCLAGHALTTAEIMIVFTLTTMRPCLPFDLKPIRVSSAYLAHIGQREVYRRAMKRGDPDMTPMLALSR